MDKKLIKERRKILKDIGEHLIMLSKDLNDKALNEYNTVTIVYFDVILAMLKEKEFEDKNNKKEAKEALIRTGVLNVDGSAKSEIVKEK